MKLRLRGNTLRLRLTRAEVAAIARGERVEDATAFGPGPDAVLRCGVEAAAVPDVRARLDGARITVVLPDAAARRWAATDAVGLSGTQPAGGDAVLAILVEKDLACAGRDDPADADAFAPPDAPRC